MVGEIRQLTREPPAPGNPDLLLEDNRFSGADLRTEAARLWLLRCWISSGATTIPPEIYRPSPMAPTLRLFKNKETTRILSSTQPAWRIKDENENDIGGAAAVLRVLGSGPDKRSTDNFAVAKFTGVTQHTTGTQHTDDDTVDHINDNNYHSNSRPDDAARLP